jgi:hypothetical protein
MSDRTKLAKLILQIERDRAAQAGLRTLLVANAALIMGHRDELQALKARIKSKEGRWR